MPFTLDLSGKVVLITGGSRGIGAACVRAFAQAGARVAFSYQQARAAAEALVAEVGAETAFAVRATLDARGEEQRLVRAAVGRYGRLDALVVNHGIWPAQDQPVDVMPEAQWHKTIATNLDSAFLLTKYSVEQMKRQGGGGSVVLVSSTAGQRGEAFHCDYAASKGALISMVKGLSTELAGHGIRVNCVAPGWVATDMAAPALEEEAARNQVMQTIPLGRLARPEEIAAPILFLCTTQAGFITGETFNVNGGAVLAG